MVEVIFGEKGTGKTKRILDLANRTSLEAKGSLVFIDDDKSYMFDLKRNVRFINAADYGIEGPKMLYGFLCGIAAQDFDLEYIFIDGFMNIVKHDLSVLEGLFSDLEAFTAKQNVHLVISASGKAEQLPEYLRKLML